MKAKHYLFLALVIVSMSTIWYISLIWCIQKNVPVYPINFSHELRVDDRWQVKACRVKDGYEFEMVLEGDKHIVAQLVHVTKDEATSVVIDCLNRASPPPPTVRLLRKANDCWIVDLELTIDDKRIHLIDLLTEKRLLLNAESAR